MGHLVASWILVKHRKALTVGELFDEGHTKPKPIKKVSK